MVISSFLFLLALSSVLCRKEPTSPMLSLFTLISSFSITGFFLIISSSIASSSFLFRIFWYSSSNTHSIPFHTKGMLSCSFFSLSFFFSSKRTSSSVLFFSSIIFVSLFCMMSSAVNTDCLSILDIATLSFNSFCQCIKFASIFT